VPQRLRRWPRGRGQVAIRDRHASYDALDGNDGSICGVVAGVNATVTPSAPTLTAADRCDRCGAQAFVRVVLSSGDLLFCAHHAKAYEDKLKATAVDWVDETASLKS
jgi:hypothetical protein